ncbi:Hypothetical protein SRAE_2000155200 [Strongyloides ratti]|uniref:Uncharacterized protein n=1 Tax=Strongyloides ratti TaxID=34506 RepID=A0A090LAR5_STRRB|nr:Hypothetical protein SRAE_2000155200 [Strongyloides ratti]CEF66886.1 Hypothetical protein SRAE_2000155200 [Strongyloides ratti]
MLQFSYLQILLFAFAVGVTTFQICPNFESFNQSQVLHSPIENVCNSIKNKNFSLSLIQYIKTDIQTASCTYSSNITAYVNLDYLIDNEDLTIFNRKDKKVYPPRLPCLPSFAQYLTDGLYYITINSLEYESGIILQQDYTTSVCLKLMKESVINTFGIVTQEEGTKFIRRILGDNTITGIIKKNIIHYVNCDKADSFNFLNYGYQIGCYNISKIYEKENLVWYTYNEIDMIDGDYGELKGCLESWKCSMFKLTISIYNIYLILICAIVFVFFVWIIQKNDGFITKGKNIRFY